MPQDYRSLSKQLDKEQESGFRKIFKEIRRVNQGASPKERAIGEEKRQLRAMESQAEKTGTKEGLAEAFRKKRVGIMKKEGFPDPTSVQKESGQIYKGLPKGTKERAKKLGSKIRFKK